MTWLWDRLVPRLHSLRGLNRHVLLVLKTILLHVDFAVLLMLRMLLREGYKGRGGALVWISRVM